MLLIIIRFYLLGNLVYFFLLIFAAVLFCGMTDGIKGKLHLKRDADLLSRPGAMRSSSATSFAEPFAWERSLAIRLKEASNTRQSISVNLNTFIKLPVKGLLQPWE
ncbi:hypothetical protein [Pontibacter pamirensis]|uniref:hypothetical protein n=1 Tax=Pontibacter pamirensis TaxID=2562824 RepID=UPI001389FC1D|nr:hypothetical protein [Pontibacter pamirensis]